MYNLLIGGALLLSLVGCEPKEKGDDPSELDEMVIRETYGEKTPQTYK